MPRTRTPAGVLPLLLVAAACSSYEEEVYPSVERSHRAIQRGRIGEGLDGYEAASREMLRYAPEDRPPWLRAFLLYTLRQPQVWSRVEARSREGRPETAALLAHLDFSGPADRIHGAARDALLSSGFNEQPGRWSRLPTWSRTELLRLTAEILAHRAVSPAPVMIEAVDVDVPAMLTDRIGRLALLQAASHYALRSWELATDRKIWVRDCRICFHAIADRLAEDYRAVAPYASDASARNRWLAAARRWKETASRVQENVTLETLKLTSDVDFVRATVQDHYESGLKAFGSAVEEYSGRGTRDLAEQKYIRCLSHLLTARELKRERTKEESLRLAFSTRAVLGVYRLIAPP